MAPPVKSAGMYPQFKFERSVFSPFCSLTVSFKL